MKRMNNKGLTLLELIVSFAIVGVAITYFYQTLNTVSKLYSKAKTQTNEFANTTYVLRLVDAKLDKIKETSHSLSGKNISFDTSSENDLSNFCKKIGTSCNVTGPKNHFYVINVEYDGKDYEIYRRASMSTNVGTASQKYKVKADSVDIEAANDKSKNYGIKYDKNKAQPDGDLTYNTSVDCTSSSSECKLSYKDETITYERKDPKDISEIENISFSKLLGEWRVFKPCNSYTMSLTTEYNKTYYGTFSVKECDFYGDNVDVTGLKAGMYIAPIVTGSWKGQDQFKCQGVIPGKREATCSFIVPGEEDGIIGTRKLDVSWLTKTGNNHRYNSANKSYDGVPYVWKLLETPQPLGISWNLAAATKEIKVERHSVTADTYVIITKKYDVYAYED